MSVANSAHYRFKRDIEHKNTNLMADIEKHEKEISILESNRHYSTASAIESAKITEMELLEIIRKKIEESKIQTHTCSEMQSTMSALNSSLIELTEKNGLLFEQKNEYEMKLFKQKNEYEVKLREKDIEVIVIDYVNMIRY